ncbi:dipeptidase [Sphingosinicella sp.]|uniref:dipeptidase n=1 Tax=Sphingosinicella sp. TaxID=1917971 RepID=UPI0035B2A89D
MTVDRREFICLASATAASLVVGRSVRAQGEADPLAGRIVINTLGFLHDGYGSRPQIEPSTPLLLTTKRLLADGRASGVTALNLTISVADRFSDAAQSVRDSDGVIQRHAKDLLKVLSTADIHRAKADNKIGIIYGFQNAAMIENDIDNVDRFADMGVRIVQLTYNTLNQLGGGSLAQGDPGLTPFGHEVVKQLNARHLIVDLSHSGRQTCLDAASASKDPIAITHTGCAALASVPRNKTDEELRAVAEKGGYVGIYFMPFLAPGRAFNSDDVVAHINHAIKVCGEDHVGIGTDHGLADLGDMATVRKTYAETVTERRAKGISAPGEDPALLPYATDLTGPQQFRVLSRKLLARGHTATQVEKVMGGNFLRFAKDVWKN